MSVASRGGAERTASHGRSVAELPAGESTTRNLSQMGDLEDEFQRLCGGSDEASGVMQLCDRLERSIKDTETLVRVEVSKRWRSGNPEREAIEAAGRRGTEEALKCLPSLRAECKKGLVLARWVDVVMSSVYCRTREEFVDRLDEILQREEFLAGIAAEKKWQLEEVPSRLSDVFRANAVLQETVRRQAAELEELRTLRQKFQDQARKLQELRQEVGVAPSEESKHGDTPGKCEENRNRGQEALGPLRGASTKRPTQVLHSGCNNGADKTEWAHDMSMWTSCRCEPQGSPKGEVCSSSASDASEVARRERRSERVRSTPRDRDQLAPYLKYIALPDVKAFSGTDKAYPFRSFREAFELKYPRGGWGDGELCALFRSKLAGRALSQYEALSREIREADYDTLVNAMEKACQAERFTEKVLALGELKKLVKREEQSVSEFCVELERLTRRAYPEMDETALAIERAHLLYEQIVHWKDSYFLTEALESAGNAYERLKETAERIERRNITLRSVASERTPTERKGSSVQSRTEEETPCSSMSERALVERKGGARSSENRKAEDSGPFPRSGRATRMPKDSKAEPVCFKCREKGHVAKNCNRVTPSRKPSSKPGAISLSARLRSTACQGRTPDVKRKQRWQKCPAFGTKMATVVELFGRSWVGLLDTGSEISILPAKVLLQAQEDGFNIDRDVPEFPVNKVKRIREASGSFMEFTALVEVLLKEQTVGGKTVKAKMHVSKVDDDVVTLGTNVLPFLGYRLVHGGNARALTAQQRAEPLQSVRKEPTSSKKKRKGRRRKIARVAEVAHRTDTTPDPSSGVQLADFENSKGNLLGSASDRKSVRCAGADSSTAAPGTNRAEVPGVQEIGKAVGSRTTPVDRVKASVSSPSSSMVEVRSRKKWTKTRKNRSSNSRRSQVVPEIEAPVKVRVDTLQVCSNVSVNKKERPHPKRSRFALGVRCVRELDAMCEDGVLHQCRKHSSRATHESDVQEEMQGCDGSLHCRGTGAGRVPRACRNDQVESDCSHTVREGVGTDGGKARWKRDRGIAEPCRV